MTSPVCPSCSESGGLYYADSWCAYCGWHAPKQTLAHANFARDHGCIWCVE